MFESFGKYSSIEFHYAQVNQDYLSVVQESLFLVISPINSNKKTFCL